MSPERFLRSGNGLQNPLVGLWSVGLSYHPVNKLSRTKRSKLPRPRQFPTFSMLCTNRMAPAHSSMCVLANMLDHHSFLPFESDIFRDYLLVEAAREGLGLFRCINGEEDSIRKSIAESFFQIVF